MAQIKKKGKLKILLWTAVISITAVAIAQIVFTLKVKTALEQENLENITLIYGKLSTNVLLGRITLHNLALQADGGRVDLKSKKVRISGMHYLPLLQNGDIILSEATLEEPVLIYRRSEKDTSKNKDNNGPQKKIDIEKFQIIKGHLEIFQEGSDSLWAKMEKINLTLAQFSLDGNTAGRKVPYTLGPYRLNTEGGFYDMGPWDFLQWQGLQLDSEGGHIQQLVLRTKYGIGELSQKLATERDHYDLLIDSLSINHPVFDPGTSPPMLHLARVDLYRPIFQVYRDKLLPDDTTHKKLYNQALRDLEMDLRVDTIGISGGSIRYQERLEADVEPESLFFTDISAKIHNLHSRGGGMVQVDIAAQLMGDGPLTLDWSFDPANKSNDFVARASLLDFDTRNISPFLRSNLNSEVRGRIDRLYFTISGHELESQGEMKMDYDEFEFVVLKKDRLGVNKLLTAVVNLFAKDGRKDDVDGFRHGMFKAKRRTDKSFFNYLWINMKAGLVNTITGNGNKEKK